MSDDRAPSRGDDADAPDDPEAPLYSGVPLETDRGVRVPRQMNVGVDNEEGGGEWPDPDTPPQAPAPGVTDPAPRRGGRDPRTEPHGP
jgi:hypothetical protein